MVAAAFFVTVGLSAGISRADEDTSHVMVFSGRDIWRNGAFTHGGMLFAPGGFDRDGLMLKLMTSGGAYRYWPGSMPGEQVTGVEWQTQVLPGFRIKRGDAEIKIFMGAEWQSHWLWPDDTANRLRGRSFGLRLVTELWWELTPRTLIAGDVSLSSIDTSHSARLAYGWRVADEIFEGNGIYIGPELAHFGSHGYGHRRFGLHITSLKTEDTEWSAGLGWAQDTDGHASPYVRLSLARRVMSGD